MKCYGEIEEPHIYGVLWCSLSSLISVVLIF